MKKDSLRAGETASYRPATYNTWSTIFVVLFLVAVHWSIGHGDIRLTWVRTFGADAGQIWAGDLFRCVTALLLHTDTFHLLSNVFGIVIFGTAVVHHCGWGVGWLMILLAGAAGNGITAGWYRQAHLSIGSSTAVFAAVGLSAALMSRICAKRHKHSRRSWMPVFGAAALMGMMGLAPHTDFAAHLFGFVSGLLFGLVYNRWFRLAGQPFQFICAILSAELVVACSIWGWVRRLWGL
ncbi:MAG: rhomboid family intramembrane serine protease [Desulfobacteraceae bacterium]|jgi:membrane associated rhomboid family serine protease